MSLLEEIIAWMSQRPDWQQHAFHRIAAGNLEQSPAAIAHDLVAGADCPVEPVATADLRAGGPSGMCVRLRSITPVAHVNALRDGQCLTLAPNGITVVYGDNASGKSGYARILKQVVHAQVRDVVLTDVFEDGIDDVPSALIDYDVNGVVDRHTWPQETTPILRQVGFYDGPCGQAYITGGTAVLYRPSMLVFLDRLVGLCDAVRAELNILLDKNTAAKVALPTVPEGTTIAMFLTELTERTTPQAIDEALTVPEDIDDRIVALAAEESRLKATDPAREKARLSDIVARMAVVSTHLGSLSAKLGDDVKEKIRAARHKAGEHRAAATLASSTSFEAEPLSGVGSETWRAMWDAARRYSEAEAYEGRDYPATEADSRCVLCQQVLPPEAGDRLQRFRRFMEDDTEKLATESQRDFETLIQVVRGIQPEPPDVLEALAMIRNSHGDLAERCRDAIASFNRRQDALLRLQGGEEIEAPAVPDESTVKALKTATDTIADHVSKISDADFHQKAAELARQRRELEGRRLARAARDDISQEVDRLGKRLQIEEARKQTDTAAITRKSTELARAHVTVAIRERFTLEVKGLKLGRVTLKEPWGRKGQLMQGPALQGPKQDADISAVLSEGEQTALGLAGFLTEAHFDQTKSALVLDDPVTSLDHGRRAHVASGLCKLAGDRQVIVFTHDLTFVGDLRKSAHEAGISFTERTVERGGDGSVGVCRDQHPWKAKDARTRLGQLEEDLARINREKVSWDDRKYGEETAMWAGSLSETWERIIHMDIVNLVFDKETSEVHPKMFRMLSRITDRDNREFQASYGRCSKWLRRHDKSPDSNYVSPDTDEMEAELRLVREWRNRVCRYAN